MVSTIVIVKILIITTITL